MAKKKHDRWAEAQSSGLDALEKSGYRFSAPPQVEEAQAPIEPESRGVAGWAKDGGISLLKGAIALPESFVGMADIATGGRVGKALEGVGYEPSRARAILDEYLTDNQKAANAEFQKAEGIPGKFAAAIQNPSVIGQAVIESAPSMLGGAGVARGLLGVAPKMGAVAAGALGEGIIGAGQAAEQIRTQTPGRLLSTDQSMSALASGAGTAVFGALGGKISQRLGIGDVDTMLAQAAVNPVARKGVVRAAIEGFISEGVLEELPQSIQEQVWQNQALGRPLSEGVDEAAVLGLLSGGAMGMVAGPMSSGKAGDPIRDLKTGGTDPLSRAADIGLDAKAKQADVGITEGQYNAAMAAMEGQLSDDQKAIKNQGRADKTGFAGQPTPKAPSMAQAMGLTGDAVQEVSAFADRAMLVKESLADPTTRDFIRQNLGDEAFNEAAYYAEQADRPGDIPDKTRENMLALAEAIISRARLTPITQPAGLGSNVGPAPDALGAPQAVPAIGLDTTPTGAFRVDAAGNAAPEVRADVISTRQAQAERDVLGAQARKSSAVPADPAPAQPQAPKALGYDTAPTGVVRVDSQGQARPETRADQINARQSAPARDDTTGQQARKASAVWADPAPKKRETPALGYDVSPTGRMVSGPDGISVETNAERINRQQARSTQPGDITRPGGQPFKNLTAAKTEQRRSGGAVVEVTGGWVVRPQAETINGDTGQTAGRSAGSVGAGSPDAPAGTQGAGFGPDVRGRTDAGGSGRADGAGVPERNLGSPVAAQPGAARDARGQLKPPAFLRKTLPEMTEDELTQASEFYGADHPRASKVKQEVEKRERKAKFEAKKSPKPEQANEQDAPQTQSAPTQAQPSQKGSDPAGTGTPGDGAKERVPAAGTSDVQADGVTGQVVDKRPKARKHPPTVRGSGALADISRALGGLSPDLLSDLSEKVRRTRVSKAGKKTQYTTWDNPAIPGIGPLFRMGGTADLSEVARVLEESGYLEAGAVENDPVGAKQRAEAIIKAELREGGRTLRVGDADAIESEMRGRQEAAMDEMSDPWDDFSFAPEDLDAAGYTSLSEETRAATEQLIAEAEGLGIDTEAIRDDTARIVGDSASQEEYHAATQEAIRQAIAQVVRNAQQAVASGAREGDQGGGSPAEQAGGTRSQEQRDSGSDQEGLSLTAPTRADIESQQDRAEQADALDEKAQAKRESEVGDSTFMTGFSGDGRQDNTADLFAQGGKPSANTIFTEDAAAAARARLKAKLGRAQSGIDPEMLMDGLTLAGYHIEKGARTFAAFARAMVDDLGEGAKPYLKSWYMGVKYDPRASGFDGMSSAAEVESAKAEDIGKKPSISAWWNAKDSRGRGDVLARLSIGDQAPNTYWNDIKVANKEKLQDAYMAEFSETPKASSAEETSPMTAWRDAAPSARREMLNAAGFTDGDQARAFSGMDWTDLPDSVRAKLGGSPSTAKSAGSGYTIVEPAPFSPAVSGQTLTQALAAAIQSGNMPKDNPALKKLVEAIDGRPADQLRMKQAQEELETAIVMTARSVVAKNEGDRSTFDVLLRLYESQPSLNIRTSTSIANQAYSTPAPLAFLASRLAGITQSTVAHEPTGGTGMLLIGADPKKAIVNELNDVRITALKSQGFNPTQKDAATQLLVPAGTQPDAVVTNPPFGSVKDADGKTVKVKVDGFNIGQIDHLIAARALDTMKDDGRATLILGANKVAGGLSTDDRIFFNWLYSHYNVVGHFEVEGDLYARQGAGWPVRVITINGREKSSKFSPLAGVIQRVDNWEQVYEQFTQSLASAKAPRAATAKQDADRAGGKPPAVAATPAATGQQGPKSGTRGAGDVAGASAGVVPDRPNPASVAVGTVPDEQRLNAQSHVPQPQPGQGNADQKRPEKPAGNAAVKSGEAAKANEFQAPYTPRSSRKDEGVLIPSNMAQPTQDALSRLEDAVGDIDEFARAELGYESVADLHNALMGLQVDSVATSIYQIKQGKAVVIADQTGIGKGRQAASIIRWAARQGMIPVFVSVKPSLFTDMYGDLADIGTNDVRPFIMNSGEWIAGEGGEKLFANKPGGHKRVIEQIADTAKLPDDTNAVFMTYSQINVANAQRQALASLAPNAVFILDESHNAAGASATGDFMIGALGAAKGVVYLSATYAKRPDNMPLYFKTDIGEAAADTEGLAVAMASGGLPLQTVVSNNLVKAGQMFRRERSYDGVSIESVFDTPNRALHERMSNEATKALRAIVAADRMFHEVYVKNLEEQLAELGSTVQDSAGNQLEAGVQHTEFSSVVHNFVKQMLLGLKAQSAADKAIESLKRGEKPIIAVENTMGSFLNEYAAANGIGQGDSLGTFDYRTVLTRALARSRVIIEVSPTGDKVKRPVPMSELDAMTQAAYEDAQSVIDGLTLSIPVSPIDWMRAEIQRAGFTVSEITGRNLSVDYGNPKKPVLSALSQAEQKDKVNTTRQFNSGKLDALILNVAGSTGISLHASEKFEDQRQRHMIVAQAAGDINIFMQMLGRVHRTGQVRLPKYSILSVDLPTEKRPTAVLSIKMKSLNANTSSNTESATSVKSSDILNKYGDQIVNQYLRDNIALARDLDLAADVGEDATEDIARKATGRLALQPIATQHAFYDEVEGQYTALIEYLNKTNQNDLEPRTFDFDAKEVRQEILFEGQNKETPFGEDAIYGEYSIKAQGTPMKPEEIRAAMAENLGDLTAQAHTQRMLDDLDAKFKAYFATLDDSGKDSASSIRSIGRAFLANHMIGSMFRVEINSEPFNAVVLNVRNSHKDTGNPYSMSKIQVSVAVNGALRSLSVPATQFNKIETSSVGSQFRVEQLFKEQPPNQRETAKIITGNLLAAYGELKGVRGTIISFTKQDGTTEQGILLPKLFDFGKNTQGDYRLPDGVAALKFLQTSENKDIGRFGIMSRDGNVRVLPAAQGIRVQVPKSKLKGAKYFLDKGLIEVGGDFVSSGSFMAATVYDKAGAVKMLDLLMKKQALYTLPSMASEAKAIVGDADKTDQPGNFSRSPEDESFYRSQVDYEWAPPSVVNRVKQQVESLRAFWKNSPEVVVLASFADAPVEMQKLNDKQVQNGAVGEPEGFFYKGKAYLLAPHMKGPEDVRRVLFHETLGHLGLRGVFGDGLNQILDQLWATRRKDVQAKADAYGLDTSKHGNRRMAAEEVLAEMAQDRPEIGFVRRAVAIVRQWLRKNLPGFAKMKMSDDEIIANFLMPAQRFIERGQGAQGQQLVPAFSRVDEAGSGFGRNMPATIKVDGKDRPTMNSNGQPIHPTEEGVRNFWSWFADSKAVDGQGRPLVVYHGTGAQFEVFDAGKQRRSFHGKGFYFTEDLGEAKLYSAGKEPVQAYLRVLEDVVNGDLDGYKVDGTGVWVVKSPTQIKSATGNSGDFNPEDPNIGFSRSAAATDLNTKARNAFSDFVGSAGVQMDWLDKTLKTQYAKAERFPEFKRVFDKLQDYIEGVSSFANQAADKAPDILPKLDSFKDLMREGPESLLRHGLSQEDIKALSAPVFEGTLSWTRDANGELVETQDPAGAGVVFTDAELRDKFGMSKKQIGHYRQFRATVDESLDQVVAADIIKLLGKKAPAGLKALANTADGRARLREALRQTFGNSDDADAKAMWDDQIAPKYDHVASMKAKGYAPLSRFGKFFVHVVDKQTGETAYFGMEETRIMSNQRARDMRVDFGPGFDVTQGTMSQESYKLMSDVPVDAMEMFASAIGAEKSEVFQKYIALAKNNRSTLKRLLKRKGRKGFSLDAPRVLASFVTSNARASAAAVNMMDAKELAQGIQAGDVKDEAIKLIEAVSEPQESGAKVRGLMFINFIGGSIASAVVNMTQPVMMTLPYLSQFGGITKAGKRLVSAAGMAVSGKVSDPEISEALKRAESEGIVAPQEIHHLLKRATSSAHINPKVDAAIQKLAFVWSTPFALAESFNRKASFIAAYQTAKDEGIANPYAFAQKAVTETQGLYNAGNKPNAARGTLGATVMTFKQYSIHYLEWLARMAKSGPDGKKAALWALALLVMAAGSDGLPFSEDLNDVIDTVGQSFGYDTNTKRWRHQVAADALGEEAAEVLSRGLSASAGFPVDVSMRMGMGNLLPATDMLKKSNTDTARSLAELAGPGGALFTQYSDAIKLMLSGEAGAAAMKMTPNALQNLGKAAKMMETGEYRDSKDRKVMDVDGMDAAMKALSFQPAQIARESAKMSENRQSEMLAKAVEGEITDAWARAMVDGDAQAQEDARQRLLDWNKKNPDMPIRVNRAQIATKAKKMRQSRAERYIKTVAPERRQAAAKEVES